MHLPPVEPPLVEPPPPWGDKLIRFKYKELEKMTDNFKQSLGEGGFGPVYHGRLENNTEVAVKLRSESSSHGFDQFLAEVTN